ncbi:hypothetical protein GCM10027059_26820 [Myceligenerans halotolerans]
MTAQTVSLPSRRDGSAPPVGRATSQATVVEQSRAVAEVAAAVQVAQTFPRDLDRAMADMRDTCSRMAVANRAFYSVPRAGGRVEGLSVHLMREIARIWGNLDYGVRELRRDDSAGESEMQAWAWDQQTNTRTTRSFIQPHQRMIGKGADKRREALVDLNEIYLSNQNVGAKAVRECIASVLPDWVIDEAQGICRRTLEHGEGKSIEVRTRESVAAFEQLGVTRAQLEEHVGAKVGKWTPVMLADLARAYTSITQEGIAASEFFPERPVSLDKTPQGAAPSGTTGAATPAVEVEGTDAATSDARPPADPPAEAPVLMVTKSQLAKIGAQMRDLDITERDHALAYIEKAIGLKIASRSELTREEAKRLIEALNEDIAQSNGDTSETTSSPDGNAES